MGGIDRHLCGHAEVQSYAGAVNLVAPSHMAEAYPRGVCVDVCLSLEVTKLWQQGITTTGCCCGHGSHDPYIGVIEADIPRMKSLGYVVAPNPMRPGDEDSFVPMTDLSGTSTPTKATHKEVEDVMGRLEKERDRHVIGYPGPRREVAVLLEQAASLLRTQSERIEELERERESWKRATMEAREGCNQRSGVIRKHIDKAEAAQATIERCREALEPFARHIDEMKFDLDHLGNENPDDEAVGWVYVTNGDFRRARTVLSSITEQTDGGEG